jgi:catechol 2,3-dioxygenase-like lactoylglutathione lyase family enzyme
VRGLGEIALRVNNMDAMQKFYEEVIGLPLMNRDSDSAFFKIAEGYGGHTQVVALFDRSTFNRNTYPNIRFCQRKLWIEHPFHGTLSAWFVQMNCPTRQSNC